jgi:hypothetical protein
MVFKPSRVLALEPVALAAIAAASRWLQRLVRRLPASRKFILLDFTYEMAARP